MNTLKYPEQEIKKAWGDLKNLTNPELEGELIFAEEYLSYILTPNNRSTDINKLKAFNKRADELGLKLTNFSKWWESRKKFYLV